MDFAANRDVYGKTLLELGRQHNDIVVLDADLSASTRTSLFAKEFPRRFFNIGVAEQNLIGFAAGLAACGKVAFASTFAIFATGRAWEQIRNTVSYSNVNVKIVCSHAGITVGEDGSSHQSLEDIALMSVIPGMTVIVPCDGNQTRKAIIATYRHKGPVYVRLNRPKFPLITSSETPFQIGKSVIMRKGKDITIIACGHLVSKSLAAADILKEQGISVCVVDMHTIKPLDTDTIASCARETGAIVTAEEHSVIGGLGSQVASAVARSYPVPVEMVGINDKFGQSGTPDELCRVYNIDTPDIVKAAGKVLARKG